MYPFVETLRVEQGCVRNVEAHNWRLNNTRKAVWNCSDRWNIETFLPKQLPQTLHKLRLLYGRDLPVHMELQPYVRKVINSLRVVECNDIEYRWKATDRSPFDNLLAQRNGADEVLIVKRGLVTDTSFTNVAFFDGKQWLTPRTPLLQGTARRQLLAQKLLVEADISVLDLDRFSAVRLFNAMIDWDSCELAMEKVLR